MQDSEFCKEITNTLDKCVSQYDKFMVLGDLKYDVLCENERKPLYGIMDLFHLSPDTKANLFEERLQTFIA